MTPSERAALVAQIAVELGRDEPVEMRTEWPRTSDTPVQFKQRRETTAERASRLCWRALTYIEAAERLVGIERHPARPDQCEACGGAEDEDAMEHSLDWQRSGTTPG